MDALALFISIFALIVSYRIVVFGKNIEIRAKKFDELVLEELKAKFSLLDNLLDRNPEDVLSIHLSYFTDVYVDIMLYVIAAKNYFPGIDVDRIQNELNDFSDKLYANSMTTLIEQKSEYKIHRMKIMCLIYDQSISHVSTWKFF